MSNDWVDLAPVAVFVYNRATHARRALRSLLSNPEASASPITVYCDGPRSDEDLKLVDETRRAVRELAPKSARIVEQEKNSGLANSIIAGVGEQCQHHGRVIVVEDDLVLSRAALRFLNTALRRYENAERVMHVAAYMFPVRRPLPGAFFYREATCWGWATWGRAWRRFEPDPAVIQTYVRSRSLVNEFNVRDSMYFWEMLKQQAEGRIDSWAIRWYGTMFIHGGLALHPGRSLVQNEGFDGSGVHCSLTNEFDVALSDVVPAFPDEINECEEAVQAMIEYRSGHKRRWINRVRRVVAAALPHGIGP
jgi:hypothetical protein